MTRIFLSVMQEPPQALAIAQALLMGICTMTLPVVITTSLFIHIVGLIG